MHTEDYDWGEASPDSFKFDYPAILSVLSKEKNKVILDIGCGNGAIANRLIDEGYEVYGIDSSVAGVEVANKKMPIISM